MAHWILPGEVDHTDNEAKHLIHETDINKVGLPQYKSSAIDVVTAKNASRHTWYGVWDSILPTSASQSDFYPIELPGHSDV